MVNFDPRIDYSKEASKTFDEYRNMKKEEQQKEKEKKNPIFKRNKPKK